MEVKADGRGPFSPGDGPQPSFDADDNEEDLQRGRVRRLRALALRETSAAFASGGRSRSSVFQSLATCLATRVAGGCLIRPLAGRECGVPVAASHVHVQARAHLKALMLSSPEALGSAYCAWVGQRGRSILTPSVSRRSLQRWTDEAAWPYLEACDIVTFLVVPVRSAERVVGTLALWREKPGLPLDEDDQLFAEEVGRRLVAPAS